MPLRPKVGSHMEEETGKEIESLRKTVSELEKRLAGVENELAVLSRQSLPGASQPGEKVQVREKTVSGDQSLEKPGKESALNGSAATVPLKESDAAYLPPPAKGSLRWEQMQGGKKGQSAPDASQAPSGRSTSAVSSDAAFPSPAHGSASKAESQTDSLETRIGLYWLNRLGIASLVVGMALLLLYSFQYFGAGLKVATGFFCSGALIFFAEWLERRQGMKWYGRGLAGGGWALSYFTAYAMYHIPQVQLLGSATVDFCLLLAIAGGAMWHSVFRKSETMAMLSLLLGFTTLSFDDFTLYTAVAAIVLLVALVSLSVRLSWYRLLTAGVIFSYLTYFASSLARAVGHALFSGNPTATGGEITIAALLLLSYWLAYNAAVFLIDEGQPRARKALATVTIINALSFIPAMLAVIESAGFKEQYLFLLACGLAYILSAAGARRLGRAGIETVHCLLGLSFATAAIPSKLSEKWTAALCSLEVAALTLIGMKLALRHVRIFAFGLSLLTGAGVLFALSSHEIVGVAGMEIRWRLVIALAAVLSAAICACAYRMERFAGVPARSERDTFFYWYFVSGGFVAWLLPALELHEPWQIPAWSALAAASLMLGFCLKDRFIRGASVAGFFWTGIFVISCGSEIGWLPAATAVALIFAASVSYRRPDFAALSGEQGRVTKHILATWGFLVLTAVLSAKISGQWLSLAWAIEGAVFLATGFFLREKLYRVGGLLLFGLLLGKLLFVDLAGAETVQRILSFIVAGLVLLSCSWGYARFSRKLDLGEKQSAGSPTDEPASETAV